MTTVSSFSGGGDPPGPAALPSDIITHRAARDPSSVRLRRNTPTRRQQARRSLFENNKFMVTGITALLENKIPFFGGVKRAAGQLPVHQVHLLALVTIGLDADIFGAAADAFDLLESCVEVVIVEIVQRIDRNDEIEMLVGVGQFRG